MLGQLTGIFFGREASGSRYKIRVPQKTCPVAKGAAHRLDHHMQRLRRPAPLGPEIVVLQDIEHFDETDTAGAGRRGSINVKASISAVDRRSCLGLIAGEVGRSDQS